MILKKRIEIIIDRCVNDILETIKKSLPKEVTLKKLKSKPCPYSNEIKCCTIQDFCKNKIIQEIKKGLDGDNQNDSRTST